MANECSIPENLGGRSCGNSYMEDVTHLLFLPSGTSYANLAAMTSVAVLAQINNVSPLLRALPVSDIDDLEPTEAEVKVKEHKSGRKSFIRRGTQTFKCSIVTGDTITVEAWNKMNNLNWDVILINRSKFQYETDLATKVKIQGFKVAKGSFAGSLTKADGAGEVEMAIVSFDFDNAIDWKLSRIASFDELGYNLSEICIPLIPIDIATTSSITTTSFIVDLKDDRNVSVSGLATSNFTGFNVTDNASVSVTVTESTTVKGRYTIAYTAQTAADVLEVTVSASGFDAYGINPISVTIPS